jgi:hypothetical protein
LRAYENDPAPGEFRVGAYLDIDNKNVVTVLREPRNDDELAATLLGDRPIYIRLPPRP